MRKPRPRKFSSPICYNLGLQQKSFFLFDDNTEYLSFDIYVIAPTSDLKRMLAVIFFSLSL